MRRYHRRRRAIRSNGYMLPSEGLHHLASSTCVLLFLVIVLVIGPAINHRTGSRQTGPQEGVAQQFRAPVDYRTAAGYARDNAVDDRPHTGGYHRDSQFGDWRKQGGACPYATTRDRILQRDLTGVRLAKGCKVAAGDFQDPYTGRPMHFAKGPETSQLVQIDHIVSVHDAWASGLWRPERAGERADYYNDPDVLQASDGQSNQDKGDGIDWQAASDPVWMPRNKAWHCDYMAKRAYIKHKYRLTMSPAEQAQTVGVLKSCAAGPAAAGRRPAPIH